MDEDQLNYLLQSSYLPSDTGFQIGQFGPNQNYLGKGMRGLESLGIGPNLNYLGDGPMTGSIGVGPNQNYLGKGLEIGSMGQPRYDSGTQTIFPSNMSPALSDLGGVTPSYGVANEEDVEQVDYLPGQEPSGIAKLFDYIPFVGEKSLAGTLLRTFLPEQDPRATGIKNFYSNRYGLTDTGQVASGIMAGYNPVYGGLLNTLTGGRFGQPTQYGLADAARRRIQRIATRKAPQTDFSRNRKQELQKFAEADTISRARQAAPDVYRDAGKEGRLGPGGGFSTSGREGAFESKSGRGRRDF